ncbi:MAG: acyltransferase family protein [Acidimicrobiia bacterium]
MPPVDGAPADAVTARLDVDAGDRQLGHVPGLDGVRGLAVLLVVVGHTQISFLPPDQAQRILDVIGGGFFGVDIFFVLSGFLITALLLNERSRRGRVWFGGFYARRALRLLPALYFMLAAYLAYSVISGAPLAIVGETGIAAIFYANNWWGVFHPLASAPGLGHIWSLSVEEQFYLVWPALLMLLIRPRRGRLLLPAICVLLAVVMADRSLYWSAHGVARWVDMFVRTDHRADSLLLGALAAVLWTRRMIPRRGIGVCAYVSVVVMAVMIARYPTQSAFLYNGGFTLFAAATAVVIIATVERAWVVNRFFESRPMRLFGRVSYGLYLWHLPVYIAVVRYTSDWAPLARFGLAVGITAGGVAVSWNFVERPAQRLRHRFAERPPASSHTRRRFGAVIALVIGGSVVALGMGVAAALPATMPRIAAAPSLSTLSPGNIEFASLVGRSPEGFVVAPSPRHGFVVDGSRYRDVDPSAKIVLAASLRGVLSGNGQAVLAVSLNGRIVAVVDTTPASLGAPSFAVFLPRTVFRRGANDLRLFEVRGDPGHPRLGSISWSDFNPLG